MAAPTVVGLRMSVLGGLAVGRGDVEVELGGAKQRAVLALLVAARGRAVAADRIMLGVWGDGASSSQRASLHTYVSNLRAVLGDVIVREGDGYRLDVPLEHVDAVVFEQQVDEARRLLSTDPEGAADRLRLALRSWRGGPYGDLIDVPGLQAEIRRLEELRLAAVELRIDADLAVGRHGLVVAEVEALAEEHPTRERFRAQHMLALYRSGRQAEALDAYGRTKSYLADELGLEPSEELRDLELQILQQAHELRAGSPRTTTQRLAFVVTDLEGSTEAWDRHPAAMAEALATHDRILREVIEDASGRVFEHTGDGVVAVLPDAVRAVAAAEAAQRALDAADWGEVGPLRVRIGIDVGEAESGGDGFCGPPLNRATRLCSIAHGGQVLLSVAAHGEVSSAGPPGLQTRQLGEHRLRGLAEPERVTQLILAGLQVDFPELRLDAELDGPLAIDVVTLGWSLPGYELRERIGEGALGVVHRAYQPSVGREVAVKIIRPALANLPPFVRRFEAQARAIARLAHPHIVPLIDFWRDPEGAYLVLQLLEGGSLLEAMAAGVDRATARAVLHQIGEALDHAHAHGIAHGDLKAANVLLDSDGHAYLSDFAIAAELAAPEVRVSTPGAPPHRAPEQTSTGPTPSADLFALGVLARDLLLAGLATDPDAEPVLARATAADPGDRYPTAAAFLADLDEALGDEPVTVERPVVSRNPYKGLRAFEEPDALDFYGRDELVATLVATVERHRFVTVVGPSGSGKSSVVQAGLLPALATGAVDGSPRWFRTVLTPGAHPVNALRDALEAIAPRPTDLTNLSAQGLGVTVADLLAETDGDLLIVVDQFEELYTLVDDPGDRRTFIDLLVDAVATDRTRVRVVATLRADFYDRPLTHERLGRLVRDGLVTVLPPTRDELLEMITRPAQAVGLRWEPGLAHRIAQDVAGQPGALPLLQYSLTEMVERRSGDLLTTGDHERIGGVDAALAGRAETVFADLTPAQQDAVRQVMLRLVTVDENADTTRRRVRRSELETLPLDRGDLDTVLDTLTDERLLLADRDPVTRSPTIEVTHEALLRSWPRLRSWIDEQRDALVLGRRFRAAMADWDAADQHDDYLLTGSRLAPFVGWANSTSLTADERAFLQTSKDKGDADRRAQARRRRVLTGILATTTLIATLLASLALVQRDRAQSEAVRAEREADVARSRELAASAISALDEDPGLSKLLALSATDIADPPLEVVATLHQAYAADRVVARYQWPRHAADTYHWADLHPNGRFVVAPGGTAGAPYGPYLEVADIESGEVKWSHTVGIDRVARAWAIGPAYFSPDGQAVLAGLWWDAVEDPRDDSSRHHVGVHIWDAETGERIKQLDLGRCGGAVAGVTETHVLVRARPDHVDACWWTWITTPGDNDVTVELVDLETGSRQVFTERSPLSSMLAGAAISRNGRYLAFNTASRADRYSTVVVDLWADEYILEFEHDSGGLVRAISDGGLLVTGDGPLDVWAVHGGERIASFDGHGGGVTAVVFSSSGPRVYSTRVDAALRGSDAAAGEVRLAAVFSSSGPRVYSTGADAALRGWDATTGEEFLVVPAVGSGRVSSVDNGRLALVPDTEARTASLIDTGPRGEVGSVETCVGPASGSQRGEGALHGFTPASSLTAVDGLAAFHAACDEDRQHASTTHVADMDGGSVSVLPGHGGQALAISPDGSRLARQEAAGSVYGAVTIRDIATGEVTLELDGLCTWDHASILPRSQSDGCRAFPATPFAAWISVLRWSPDGAFLAATDRPDDDGYLAVWDARDGELVFAKERPREAFYGYLDLFFTADSKHLLVSYADGSGMEAISTETWDVIAQRAPDPALDAVRLAGYVDEILLVGIGGRIQGGAGALVWLDTGTLEVTRTKERIHEGTVTSMALSSDRALLATGASDGLVRVWESGTGRLVHQIPLGHAQVQGVAFVNDRHLAVTPEGGDLLIFTVDTDELVDLVRSSLTRGFTETECERFGFEDECPTLEELRGT